MCMVRILEITYALGLSRRKLTHGKYVKNENHMSGAKIVVMGNVKNGHFP